MLELLAPAGDLKSFDAALNNGADAIYLGLSDFNARIKADNFDESNLRLCVEKAHFLGVKIYVTLNTLVQNDEFNAMLSLVKVAVSAKVDAFIVQDLGVVKVLKSCFPNIVLHASTQMGIHNLDGAKQAERLGLKRVVLSRETKLEDIALIKQNTSLEIEYFVQGALCVAFSGNCYLSSMTMDMSGNRGVCRQPCRMCYGASFDHLRASDESRLSRTNKSFEKDEDGYLLSARDLCLLENLKTLADAGVTSFKIEGRLRRAGYVAEAVSCYREALDKLLFMDKGQAQGSYKSLRERLMRAFSRGSYLDRAYLDKGVPDGVVNKTAGNHQGVRIGKVMTVKPFRDKQINAITIQTSHALRVGDGLKLFSGAEEIDSLGVGDLTELSKGLYLIHSKAKAQVGNEVRLLLDSKDEEEVLAVSKKVPIALSVKARVGEAFEIEATAVSNAQKAEPKAIASGAVVETAKNAPTTVDELKEQMKRTADSGFETVRVDVDTENAFLPKSVQNALRREVLEKLKAEIIAENEKTITAFADEKAIKAVQAEIERFNAEVESNTAKNGNEKDCACSLSYVYTASDAMKANGSCIVLSPSNYSLATVKSLIENVRQVADEPLALDLPIIANGEDLKLLNTTLEALKNEIKILVSNNLYGLSYANLGYEIIVGFGENAFNSFAIEQLKKLGASKVVESVELKTRIASSLPVCETHNFDLPLMTFAHCPYKTLFGNSCGGCLYTDGLTLKQGKNVFKIRRVMLSQCYFQLKRG